MFLSRFAKSLAISLFGASVLLATPSTQIWIPSTDIQGFLKPHIGWDVYLTNTGYGAISNGGITMGVLPFEKLGLEIGVDYRVLGGDHSKPIYLNAKLGTPEGAFFKFMPALAVGGYDFGFMPNDAMRYNILYGLAAKNIWKLGRFSIGGFKGAVGSDPDKTFYIPSDPAKVDDVGLLVSWDRVMSELSDNLWLAVDFQSGSSYYGALSFGASWNFAPNASVILGYDIYNDRDAVKPTFTVQFDLNAF